MKGAKLYIRGEAAEIWIVPSTRRVEKPTENFAIDHNTSKMYDENSQELVKVHPCPPPLPNFPPEQTSGLKTCILRGLPICSEAQLMKYFNDRRTETNIELHSIKIVPNRSKAFVEFYSVDDMNKMLALSKAAHPIFKIEGCQMNLSRIEMKDNSNGTILETNLTSTLSEFQTLNWPKPYFPSSPDYYFSIQNNRFIERNTNFEYDIPTKTYLDPCSGTLYVYLNGKYMECVKSNQEQAVAKESGSSPNNSFQFDGTSSERGKEVSTVQLNIQNSTETAQRKVKKHRVSNKRKNKRLFATWEKNNGFFEETATVPINEQHKGSNLRHFTKKSRILDDVIKKGEKKNVGKCLLQKMGWKPGEGLGKHKNGVKEPINSTKFN